MKKDLAILSDNNQARLVIDHIVGYYISNTEKKNNEEAKHRLQIFFDYPYKERPLSEEFFYGSFESLKADAAFLDSFFNGRDINEKKPPSNTLNDLV